MTTVILAFVFFICFIGLKLLSKGIRLENDRRTNERLNRLESKVKGLEKLWVDSQKDSK